MKGLGYMSNLAEVRGLVSISIGRICEPDMERQRRYPDLHKLFQKLYRGLEDDFDILHELSTKG